MSDLVRFLLAEIAADEADPYCDGADEYQRCAEQSDRRRLECEAKRRIVALHEPIDDGFHEQGRVDESGAMVGRRYWHCPTCDYDRDYGHIGGPNEGCDTLRLLAIPYADRPGFREEWRP